MLPEIWHQKIWGVEIVISAYGLFLGLALLWGVLVGIIFLRRSLLKSRISWRKANRKSVLVVLSAAMGGLMGARMLHVLLNGSFYDYGANWSKMTSFQPMGLSIYGGILGAVLLGLLMAKGLRVPLWKLGDAMVPGFAGAVVLARIGCFLNGCCYGGVTELPWGMHFAPGTAAFNYEVSVGIQPSSSIFAWFNLPSLHPTQLYEIFAVLVLTLVYGGVWKYQKKPGDAFLVFFTGYTAFRLFNHMLRVPPPTFDASPLFYPVFYMGICMVLLCLWKVKRHDKAVVGTRERLQ